LHLPGGPSRPSPISEVWYGNQLCDCGRAIRSRKKEVLTIAKKEQISFPVVTLKTSRKGEDGFSYLKTNAGNSWEEKKVLTS
jgi:hypothetical protein